MKDTIAIIGNAPSALDYKAGKLIDESRLVVRMNNFEIRAEWTAFIGSKTDIFACNLYLNDIRQTQESLEKHEISKIWASIPAGTRISHWTNDYEAAADYFGGLEISELNLTDFCNVIPSVKNRLLLQLSNLFGNYFYHAVREKVIVPSTGLVAIYRATLEKPKSILISGFDFFTGTNSHYFQKKNVPEKTHHNFSYEPTALSSLVARNKQIDFHFCINPTIFETYFEHLSNTANLTQLSDK